VKLEQRYSKRKTIAKGVQTSAIAIVTAAAAIVGTALQSPDVVNALTAAWPGIPVAAAAGIAMAFVNWLKNRDRRD
jgi:hypothetical protein